MNMIYTLIFRSRCCKLFCILLLKCTKDKNVLDDLICIEASVFAIIVVILFILLTNENNMHFPWRLKQLEISTKARTCYNLLVQTNSLKLSRKFIEFNTSC